MTEATYKLSIREKIHGYLMHGSYYTCKQIHEALGGKKDSIASELRRMFVAGLVMRRSGDESCRYFTYCCVPTLVG